MTEVERGDIERSRKFLRFARKAQRYWLSFAEQNISIDREGVQHLVTDFGEDSFDTDSESDNALALLQLVALVVDWDGFEDRTIPTGFGSNARTQLRDKARPTSRKPARELYSLALDLEAYLKDLELLSKAIPVVGVMTSDQASPNHLNIVAERWVPIAASTDLRARIHDVGAILDGILTQISKANVAEHQQLLTDLERAELIAILETTLNLLKSPMVETGLLSKAKTELQGHARKSLDKKIQEGLGSSMTRAAELLAELLKSIGIGG